MIKPNTTTFNTAVTKYFEPLAAAAKLTIHALNDSFYEVRAKEFTIRIRRGTGHRKDILVTLLPTAEQANDNDDLSKEIGLGLVAEFGGETLPELSIDTEEEYFRSAAYLATAAGKWLLPYLIGARNDFTQLKKFVAARVDKAVGEIPDYRFPKKVRKEWI